MKPIETASRVAPPFPFSFASTISVGEPSGRRFGTARGAELEVVMGDISEEARRGRQSRGTGARRSGARRAAGPGLPEAFHSGPPSFRAVGSRADRQS